MPDFVNSVKACLYVKEVPPPGTGSCSSEPSELDNILTASKHQKIESIPETDLTWYYRKILDLPTQKPWPDWTVLQYLNSVWNQIRLQFLCFSNIECGANWVFNSRPTCSLTHNRKPQNQELGKYVMLVCGYSTSPAWMNMAAVTIPMCGLQIVPWRLFAFPFFSTFPLSLLIESFVLRSKFNFPMFAVTPTTADPIKHQPPLTSCHFCRLTLAPHLASSRQIFRLRNWTGGRFSSMFSFDHTLQIPETQSLWTFVSPLLSGAGSI